MTSTSFPYWIGRRTDGSYYAHFPTLPEVETSAPSIKKLEETLQESVLVALEHRVKTRDFPKERGVHPGEELFHLSPSYAAKYQLIMIMRETGATSSDLAHRLNILPQEATRLMKMTHSTKINSVETAIAALGYKLEIVCTPRPATDTQND